MKAIEHIAALDEEDEIRDDHPLLFSLAMPDLPTAPTVFARVLEQRHLSDDELKLVLDVVVMAGDAPVSFPKVVAKLSEETEEAQLDATGRHPGLKLLMPFRREQRDRLRLWAVGSEASVTEVEIVGDEYAAQIERDAEAVLTELHSEELDAKDATIVGLRDQLAARDQQTAAEDTRAREVDDKKSTLRTIAKELTLELNAARIACEQKEKAKRGELEKMYRELPMTFTHPNAGRESISFLRERITNEVPTLFISAQRLAAALKKANFSANSLISQLEKLPNICSNPEAEIPKPKVHFFASELKVTLLRDEGEYLDAKFGDLFNLGKLVALSYSSISTWQSSIARLNSFLKEAIGTHTFYLSIADALRSSADVEQAVRAGIGRHDERELLRVYAVLYPSEQLYTREDIITFELKRCREAMGTPTDDVRQKLIDAADQLTWQMESGQHRTAIVSINATISLLRSSKIPELTQAANAFEARWREHLTTLPASFA